MEEIYKDYPLDKRYKVSNKKIVLNSMGLKWNLVVEEFKNLTKKLNFD